MVLGNPAPFWCITIRYLFPALSIESATGCAMIAGMGQTIDTVTHMMSYAGDLRRAAKQAQDNEQAAKLQKVAASLETQALQKSGITSPHIGKLLDTLA